MNPLVFFGLGALAIFALGKTGGAGGHSIKMTGDCEDFTGSDPVAVQRYVERYYAAHPEWEGVLGPDNVEAFLVDVFQEAFPQCPWPPSPTTTFGGRLTWAELVDAMQRNIWMERGEAPEASYLRMFAEFALAASGSVAPASQNLPTPTLQRGQSSTAYTPQDPFFAHGVRRTECRRFQVESRKAWSDYVEVRIRSRFGVLEQGAGATALYIWSMAFPQCPWPPQIDALFGPAKQRKPIPQKRWDVLVAQTQAELEAFFANPPQTDAGVRAWIRGRLAYALANIPYKAPPSAI